jgi:outer membrane autotransporter protein
LSDGSGTLGLTKTGLGTLILTGTNTYTGGTTVTGGTLQIGNGWTMGSIVGNVTDDATLAFDRSDSVTFAGTITGSGSLAQMGLGTLILTADNLFTGATNIAAVSTLQLGNGGTTGNVAGNIVDNGLLSFNRSNTLDFARVISGTGSVQQNGSGTTILSGTNTYTGGTVVNAGTLEVNNAQALGLGDVQVNGGVLRADPQPINVQGNYTQNGGTLLLQVAGANAGQYDFLNVGGNANLGGTLQLMPLGYLPKAGDLLKVVTTGGVVSGQFAHFSSPFTVGPGLNTIDLVYGRNSVQVQFLNVTTPISPVIPTVPTTPTSSPAVPPKVIATRNFASFALTANQRSAATLLDQVELDPRTADLIGFLLKQPSGNLPGDFEGISPAALTAFYEIGFSGANIQKLNLEGRFDDIRNGSSGFSSNVKVNEATVNLEDKATVNGSASKSTVEPILQPGPENRWGVWMTGFGDFVTVDADSNAQGYDFTTGGVSLGIDYRILDHLAIGVMGDYAHTWTSLNPSGHIDVDTGRGGVYATWFNHGLYLNTAIYGGHNSYDSSRSTLGGLAAGGTEGAEFSTFAGGGYDFNFGHLTVGPIASIQYTYVNINGFSEKSSLAPLEIHSTSAESLRTDFGFRASFYWQIGKILVEPAIKAAWEHEYKYSALPITAGFAAVPGPSATFFGPSEGHDSAIVNAGITVQLTPAIATYLNYDGQLGRDRYDSNAVTGGVRITF